MYELVKVMCRYIVHVCVCTHVHDIHDTRERVVGGGGEYIIIMYIQIRFAKKVSWRLLCAYIVHP